MAEETKASPPTSPFGKAAPMRRVAVVGSDSKRFVGSIGTFSPDTSPQFHAKTSSLVYFANAEDERLLQIADCVIAVVTSNEESEEFSKAMASAFLTIPVIVIGSGFPARVLEAAWSTEQS